MVDERGKGNLFPHTWCHPDRQEFVLEWIRWLQMQPEGKKQVLLLWCDCARVKLTREMVEYVLAE